MGFDIPLKKQAASRKPYVLIVGSGLTIIVGILFWGYTVYQEKQIHLLEIQLDDLASKQKSVFDRRDRLLKHVLPAALAAPILKYPINGSSVVGDVVHLAWEKPRLNDGGDDSRRAPIVELQRVDRQGLVLQAPISKVATDPEGGRSRFPFSGTLMPEDYGEYIWRVAPGRLNMSEEAESSAWSTYFRFNVYPSRIEKIVRTGNLLVGVYFSDDSIMKSDSHGEAMGLDKDLVDALIEPLSELLGKKVKAQYVPFSRVEGGLYDGLLQGHIDMAIGNLSRTKYRERRGVVFSRIYRPAPMILVGHETHPNLKKGATIGVVERTLHSRAAEEIRNKYNFKRQKNFQELMYEFAFGDLEFIILDAPMIEGASKAKKVLDLQMEDSLRSFYRDEIGYTLGHAIAFKDNELRRLLDLLLCRIERQRSSTPKPYPGTWMFDPIIPPYLRCATSEPPLKLIEE